MNDTTSEDLVGCSWSVGENTRQKEVTTIEIENHWKHWHRFSISTISREAPEGGKRKRLALLLYLLTRRCGRTEAPIHWTDLCSEYNPVHILHADLGWNGNSASLHQKLYENLLHDY